MIPESPASERVGERRVHFMDRWSRGAFLAVGLLACAGSALAQGADKADVKAKLEAKRAKNRALEEKARLITSSIGDLAKSGKLPTDDEGIALMRKMVEELAGIREELKHQDVEIDALYKATGISKPKEEVVARQGGAKTPTMDERISSLERFRVTGYEQAQYRNSNQTGKEESAFYSKRSRINLEYRPDNAMVGFRASFDLSSSPVVTGKSSDDPLSAKDGNVPLTKDAYVHWNGLLPGSALKLDAMVGQFPMNLGYELARSDADREFPERSIFNDTLFKGQRLRGVNFGLPFAGGVTLQGGLVDALSTEDPEQLGYPAGSHGRLAGTAALTKRQTIKNKTGGKSTFEVGLSGLAGKRPQFVGVSATSPEVDRKYGEAHAVLQNLFGKGVDFRGEAMVGKDRVPNANPSSALPATNMSGLSGILGFNFNSRNRLDLRWDQFNSNLNVSHKTINQRGLAYNLSYGAYRLTLGRDFVEDQNPAIGKYSVTTIRVQFKF